MAEEEPKKVTDTVNNVSEQSPSPSAPAKEAVVTAVVAPQEKPVAPPPVLPSPAPVEKKLEDPKALISIIASKIIFTHKFAEKPLPKYIVYFFFFDQNLLSIYILKYT